MRQHLITIKIIDDETGSELWTDEVDLSAVLAFKGKGFLFKSDLEAEKMEEVVVVDEDKNTEVKRSENLDDDETQVNPEQNEDTTVEPNRAAEVEEEETKHEVDEIEE